ncbi:MAG: hypothetical protein PHZ05_07495, partial [Pygmaiobacter massiliensis]|nr:hypothetical protein [Pygmaiobacter massiliensis]
ALPISFCYILKDCQSQCKCEIGQEKQDVFGRPHSNSKLLPQNVGSKLSHEEIGTIKKKYKVE